MKTKLILCLTLIILCLALILNGGLFDYPSRPIPTIEYAKGFISQPTNEWSGHNFSEIIPPQKASQIILLEERNFQGLFSLKASPDKTRDYYNHFFNHLEHSSRKTQPPYLQSNEEPRAGFAVITSSGNLIHIQVIGDGGLGGGSLAAIISSNGISTRLNVPEFQETSPTNRPVPDTKQLLPSVETDYALDQNAGDWLGRRFKEIIPLNKIKRLAVLEEDMTILDHFVATPELHKKLLQTYHYDQRVGPPPATEAAVNQQEHQIGYGKLFDRFEASSQKAEKISLANNEGTRAKLVLITDAGKVIYLEIVVGIEHHITGVLIHGPGKGVRINLNILPASFDVK